MRDINLKGRIRTYLGVILLIIFLGAVVSCQTRRRVSLPKKTVVVYDTTIVSGDTTIYTRHTFEGINDNKINKWLLIGLIGLTLGAIVVFR